MSRPPDDNLEFTAVCSRGVEGLLAEELREILGSNRVREDRGAVLFRGSLSQGYRACLWSRLVVRILLLIGGREAVGERGLYEASRSVDWTRHLGPDNTFAVDFVGRDQDLRDPRHSGRVVKDGIADRMRDVCGRRPSVDFVTPDVQINAHLRDRWVVFSVDLSGESLHRRTQGSGRSQGGATLKENLAAAMLWAAEWPKLATMGVPLVDPMCGTGTILLEAGAMAQDRAPGLNRGRWGFERWRGHDPQAWRQLWEEATVRAEAGAARPVALYGSDRDPDALFAVKDNARLAKLEIRVRRCDVADLEPPEGDRATAPRGLLVTNPPYGVRLGDEEEARQLHRTLGNVLRRRFLGWSAWILAGPGLASSLGLRASLKIPIWNGPLDCRLVRLDIHTEPPEKPPPRPHRLGETE